ncbi:MAG: MFS transporter, partial [Candidatus Hydrogenedentes bacterium]|nr:MFS transporter [Candidatus Hydrogenedentota bacterium]
MASAKPHPTLEVLASRDVRFFVASRFFSATAQRLMGATIAWHIFAITGSAFWLGLIGIVQFLPVLPMSLLGGAVADAYDRRRIALLAQGAALLCSTSLWLASARGEPSIALILGVVFLISIANAFENPARSALLPTLVPRNLFVNAVTLHATAQNLAWMTGPVLMGFLIDLYGVSASYSANVFLLLVGLALLACVRARTAHEEKRGVTLAAIREGISFVRHRSVIWSCMVLDLFAVIFAGATALLPIYANDILQVGARGYGILSASLEMGTFLMAALLLILPPIVRPGRALLFAVGVYGLATIVFGFSRWFPLSIAAFALAGMADQVSMVCRSTIIQLSTPDALRGRVSSVNMVFINASNQLGIAESGFLAAVTNAVFSVVAGGFACLGVLGIVAARVPSLRHYR